MFNNFFASTREFGKDEVELYGSEAARSYLNIESSLDEKIASIAMREKLNKEQIQRIVEEANTLVDLNKEGEKFSLAKTANVLIIMRKRDERPEMESDDYDVPPCMAHPDEKEISINDLFGVSPIEPEIKPSRAQLNIKIVKLGAAREELDGKKRLLELKYDSNIQDIIKTAEQLYFNDKKALSNIFGLAKIAYSYGKNILGLVDNVLQRREVLEKNASVAPEDLISDEMRRFALIQNGEHKILKQIDNIGRIKDDIAHVKVGILKLDDEIVKTKEKIKGL
jgi:hypothetical protein